jgi:TolB-like protein
VPTRRVLAPLVLLLAGLPVQAAEIAVAVMPFRDLARTGSDVGEAIRESVTADLRGVPGIKVVERGEIDRVLSEQKLQGRELEEDPLAAVRVGKLIGASLMTVGAYQRVDARVRLTARFVRVETGEVVGSAKVDGQISEFLALQDRITVELLKSAKLAPRAQERIARRARPKLRSLRPVELYGQAAKEKDEPMRRALLREVVKEEPSFGYAVDALRELEERLRQHQRRLQTQRQGALAQHRARLAGAAGIAERASAYLALCSALEQHRMLNEALGTGEEAIGWLQTVPEPDRKQPLAQLAAARIRLLERLARREEALEAGEAFMSEHPDSHEFSTVRAVLQKIIQLRLKEKEGKAKAEAELAALRSEQRWNPCNLGRILALHQQRAPARRMYLACLAAGTDERAEALGKLADLEALEGRFEAARDYLQALEEESPARFEALRQSFEWRVPVDG